MANPCYLRALVDTLELVRANLLSPMVLAFVLGIIATRVKSDLKFPEELYTGLTIYLLLAIGLKGGAELSETHFSNFWKPMLATLFLGVATPLWCVLILRRFGGFDLTNSAAIAAHYGSVSAVTFIAATTFLQRVQEPVEGFAPTLMAILEVPAIVVALAIATRQTQNAGSTGKAMHEVLTSRSVILLVGGLVIGFLSGKSGVEPVAPFFRDLFRGALTLFLLDMGMVTARRFADLRRVGRFLIGFGILMPVLHGVLGVALGRFAGLSVGGATILGVMAASASYIAAPAAVRIALPQANPTYYLTAALAVTFPFNLSIGIPLYYEIAIRLRGG